MVDANATLQQARSACVLHSGDVVAYDTADKQLMVEVRLWAALARCGRSAACHATNDQSQGFSE